MMAQSKHVNGLLAALVPTLGAGLLAVVPFAAHAQTGVFVQQVGSANKAQATQNQAAVAGRAVIAQDGEDNEATVIQQGGSHRGEVAQDGAGNDATLVQQGAGNHEARIAQSGARNVASIAQNGVGVGVLASQSARVTQTGSDNTLNLSQTGTANSAELTQLGDGNTMNLAQTGGSTVTWIQEGDGLSGVQLDVGAGQVINLIQTRP
jgi:Curlin associated repeat